MNVLLRGLALLALCLLTAAPALAQTRNVGPLMSQNNGADIDNAAQFRANLGLGAVSTLGIGTGLGQCGSNLCVTGGGPGSNVISGGTIDGSLLGSTAPVTVQGERRGVTLVSTAAYTTTPSDRVVCISPTAPTIITLLSNPGTGTVQTITDCSGQAALNNISVQASAGQIMGYDAVVMTQPRMALEFLFTGSAWVLQ